MTRDANEQSRLYSGSETLYALLGAVKQAIKNQDPFPFLPAIRDGLLKAHTLIGRDEPKRMAAYWYLQGVIATMDTVDGVYPVEVYSRLCWMAASIVNTNSAAWIIGQKEDVDRIIADVLAAKADNAEQVA